MENMRPEVSFEWDGMIENESAGFNLLPEGVYPFTVVEFARGRHEGSPKLPACYKAILDIKLDGGPLGPTIVKGHNLFLHSKTEGLLCEFFTAIGARKHGETFRMDWSKVPGASGYARVSVDTYIDKNGIARQINRIKNFVDPEEAPKPVQPAQPTQMKRWTPGAAR